MDIRKIKIGLMNPATYNPRKLLQPGDAAYEKLAASIEAFGYIDPIIWNERTGNIVGGHQRYNVLVSNGHTELEVSVVDLSESEEKALNVALNKIEGEWDQEKLAELLEEIQSDTNDMLIHLTGFADKELEKLIRTAEATVNEVNGEYSIESSFHYKEQYGVIVMCQDEADQQKIYEDLTGQGYECKVVAT